MKIKSILILLTAILFYNNQLFSQACCYYVPYKSQNGLMGYCDTNRRVVIQPKFQKAYFFQSQKLALISNEVNEVELFGLINERGETVLSSNYLNIQLYLALFSFLFFKASKYYIIQ